MSTKDQRQKIFGQLGFQPSLEQARILDATARTKLVAGGERGGKSKVSAMEYIGRFFETPLLWLIAADYERTRAEFNYICQAFDKLGVTYEASKRVDPGEILVSGGKIRITTKSAKDPRKIAMEAPDGIIGCEASQLDYETYLRIRGRAAEKRAWVLLSGTFESSLGWYPMAYYRWQVANSDDAASFSLPTWSNLSIFPGGREDPEIKVLENSSSKEWFMERYGGVPCPPRGLVFNEFRNDIHTGVGGKFEYESAYPVYLWIDPGFSHYYSVLVAQKKGDEVYIVDEIYEHGLMNSQVITACKQRPWWEKVAGGAIDVSATYHHGMEQPAAQIWSTEANLHLDSQKIKITDGIERVKTCLKVNPITNRPQLFVNAKCLGLISEMGGGVNPHSERQEVYAWKMDKDGNVLGDVPEDKHNDACKALCYGLVSLLGFSNVIHKGGLKFY